MERKSVVPLTSSRYGFSAEAASAGTASLGPSVCGARLGGADEETLAILRRFGRSVGVAFQIADDLLDEDEDDPCSLLRAMPVEAARSRAEALLTSALKELEDLGEPDVGDDYSFCLFEAGDTPVVGVEQRPAR